MTLDARWLERHAGLAIVSLACLFSTAYLTSLVLFPKADGRVVVGDALHHYVQLRSAVFDRDLHFKNEYVRMYRLQGGEPGTEWIYQGTATGHVRNLMPVGPAIVWAPAFLLVTGLTWLGQFIGWQYPMDGYGRVFQATAAISGIVAASCGVWFSFLAASDLFGRRTAAWSAIVLWLSSSAIYYSAISPAYSHSASLLTSGLFWFAFVKTRSQVTLGRYALLGVLAGLAALMRWQDAILLIVPAINLVWNLRQGTRFGKTVALGLATVISAVVAFTPQILVWQTLYGQPFAIPQGESFMRWGQPALVPILFSDWHGLFTWTPLIALAVAGLPFVWKRDGLVCAASVTFILLSWYVNASVADWWAGEAFGARRFISCLPVFVLGLGALIDRWSPSARTLAFCGAAVIAHTFLLLFQYQLFMHGLRDVVPYPRGAYGLWIARFVVPFKLLTSWCCAS
jgi:hypothetical protein